MNFRDAFRLSLESLGVLLVVCAIMFTAAYVASETVVVARLERSVALLWFLVMGATYQVCLGCLIGWLLYTKPVILGELATYLMAPCLFALFYWQGYWGISLASITLFATCILACARVRYLMLRPVGVVEEWLDSSHPLTHKEKRA